MSGDYEEKGFWVEGSGPTRKVHMTKLYNVWSSMRSRCLNPKHHAYARYGGRGITVCHEWDDFSAFRAWALSTGYMPGLYLDREKNSEGYSPANCRWLTAAGSVRNRDVTKLTEETAAEIRRAPGLQREIAEKYGISREHVRDIKRGKLWRSAS